MEKKEGKRNLSKKTFSKMFCMFLCSVMIFSTPTQVYMGKDMKNNQTSEELESVASQLSAPDNLKLEGYDVVYVIDNSRSIWSQQDIRNQAFRNITNLAVGSDIRVGVVYFADQVYDTLSLTSMKTQEDSKKVLDFLNMTQQNENNIDTNIGTALETAIQLFDGQNSSRQPIIVLFSDGINENLMEDASYTQAANEKTQQQVAILKQHNIPIYCVHLQKQRTDEAYLKSLINYFSNDNNYESERFFKVEESEIAKLSDTFEDVFFAMQNNVKCSPIRLDSSGTANFYVPSLGINQLRIYLDGDNLEGSVIPAGECKESNSWRNETANFLSYEEPASGDWAIKIEKGDIGKIYGSITYRAFLQVNTELQQISEDNTEKKYQLILHFYDENGTEIELDTNATVETDVFFEAQDGTQVPISLAMEVKNGLAKSQPFSMEGYGTYQYQINLKYEDTLTNEELIDLSYSVEGGSILPTAPIVFDLGRELFKGAKTEQGVVFSIKQSELFSDPEGEEVTITGFNVVNLANSVLEIEQKDGYLYITTEDFGDVEVELQLQDTSGMTAEVTLQGEVIDQEAIQQAKIWGIVAMVLLVVLVLLFLVNKKKKEGQLQKMLEEFDQLSSKFERKVSACEEQVETWNKQKEFLEQIFSGLKDFAEEFEKEQLAGFEVLPYLEEDYLEKNLGSMDEEKNDLENAKKKVDDFSQELARVRGKVKNVTVALKNVSNAIVGINTELSVVVSATEKFREQQRSANNLMEALKEKGGELAMILDTKIVCSLQIGNIASLPGERGLKMPKDIRNQQISGYYKLDDIRLLNGNTLGKCIGKTHIYVYGVQDSTGLCLRTHNGFAYKVLVNGHYVEKNDWTILKGEKYELQVYIEECGTYEKMIIVVK